MKLPIAAVGGFVTFDPAFLSAIAIELTRLAGVWADERRYLGLARHMAVFPLSPFVMCGHRRSATPPASGCNSP